MQLSLLKLVKKHVELSKLDFSYVLSQADIEREGKYIPSYEFSIRKFLSGGKKEGKLGVQFDVIQCQNRKVLSLLAKSGISFNIADCIKGLSPLLWACYLRDLQTIKILVEEAKASLNKAEQDLAVKILR